MWHSEQASASFTFCMDMKFFAGRGLWVNFLQSSFSSVALTSAAEHSLGVCVCVCPQQLAMHV